MVHDLIRLFSEESKEFESNGLGSLFEATKCIVTEEANGSFELEMTYPIWGKRYKDIQARSLIVTKTKPFGSPQAFRVYAISKPMNGVVTYNAQHISYDLSGYPVTPFTAEGCAGAMTELKNHSLEEHNFEFWTDKETKGTFEVAVPMSTRSLLGGTEGSLLDIYKGDYEFDNFTVKLYEHRGVDRGVVIRYGKNMTDFNQEENIANVRTGIYPYWKGTDDEENSVLIELPERIVNGEGTYNFVNIEVHDFSSDFDEQPSADELRTYTEAWIKDNKIGVPKVSIEVSFVQLSQSVEYKDLALLEQIDLFDTVSVEFENLGVSAKAEVAKIEYNALTDRYEQITLGDIRSSISDSVVSNSQSITESENRVQSQLDKAVTNATKWITNGKGYMVAVRDENGTWTEIVSLDEPSISAAKNVWRWNNGGFGFSSNGYNGPYRLALTQDGHIVADFIDTGTLTASIIKAGILQDVNEQAFYLDLINGILRMKGSLTVGGNEDQSGVITVQDANGKNLVTMDHRGITLDPSVMISWDNINNKPPEIDPEAILSPEEITNLVKEKRSTIITKDFIESMDIIAANIKTNSALVGHDITIGGVNNQNGSISVRDASNNEIVWIDRNGIYISYSGALRGFLDFAKIKTNAALVIGGYTGENSNDCYGFLGATDVTSFMSRPAIQYAGLSDVPSPSDFSDNATYLAATDYLALGIRASKYVSDYTSRSIAVYMALRQNTVYCYTNFICDNNVTAGSGINIGNSYSIRPSGSTGHPYMVFRMDTTSSHNLIYGNANDWYCLGPASSDGLYLGSPFSKWAAIYSTNSAIQTSDRNQKNSIVPIDNKYEELFKKLKPVTYKLNSGDRTHTGFISQDVEESLNELDMSPMDWGGFCKDVDLEGNEFYSMRYSEVIAMNTHMIQKLMNRIDILEQRIAKLERGEN